MKNHPRSGFTLVELLIVISLIALLMGLLFPVFSAVRGQARATKCRHNLNQFGYALSLYVEDYRGWLPRRGQGVRPVHRIDRSSDWFNALPPYLDSDPYQQLVAEGRQPRAGDDCVLICPEAEDPGGDYFLPLAMNMYLSPWIRPQPHNLDELPRPSLLVFMADAPGPYASTVPSKNDYSVVPRHSGNANLVFVDSHVDSFSGDYLGCFRGNPERGDVQWQTHTSGINQEPVE
jgi:prepilin-type N-terminal cleavage/methylation domain-containing protein/prepilin-type processing-associated H-X9-DG protein